MVLLGYVTLSSDTRRRFAFELLTQTVGVCVQENCLWVADPKAINHIHQKSGYLYTKQDVLRERLALVADRGILWVQGEFPAMIGPFLL